MGLYNIDIMALLLSENVIFVFDDFLFLYNAIDNCYYNSVLLVSALQQLTKRGNVIIASCCNAYQKLFVDIKNMMEVLTSHNHFFKKSKFMTSLSYSSSLAGMLIPKNVECSFYSLSMPNISANCVIIGKTFWGLEKKNNWRTDL